MFTHWLARMVRLHEREGRQRERLRTRRPALEVLEGRVVLSTFLVDNALDNRGIPLHGTLRSAIANANLPSNAGSIVVITPAVTSPVIDLVAGQLPIKQSMTIENASGHPLTIEQTTPNSRAFFVTASRNATAVSINGLGDSNRLTISGGALRQGNGGGISVNNKLNTLALSYVDVTGNSAPMHRPQRALRIQSGNGGGIFSLGAVSLVHSNVNANSASGIAGGVGALRGVSLAASNVNSNSAYFGGGIVSALGNVTLDDASSVSNNVASGGVGGGIADAAGSVSVLNSSHVDGNQAAQMAGIMDAVGSVSVLNGSTVNSNSASGGAHLGSVDMGGGGIAVESGSVTVSDSLVNNNHAAGLLSGGIATGVGDVNVTNGSQVNGNSGNGPGGGIAVDLGGTVNLSGSEVINNTASTFGGGIVNASARQGSVNIGGGSRVDNNTINSGVTLGQAARAFSAFSHNNVFRRFVTALGGHGGASATVSLRQVAKTARQTVVLLRRAAGHVSMASGSVELGGGVATLLGSPITVAGASEVNGNRAGTPVPTGIFSPLGLGGGIFAFQGPVTVNNSTVANDSATGNGGGLWNGGTLTINGSTVQGNTASASTTVADGGGLYNAPKAHATVLGSTFRGNQAAAFGGGMANEGVLSVINTTVANNRATANGGGISNGGKLNQTNVTYSGNAPNDVSNT